MPGHQSQALLAENTYNSQGQLISTTPARMAPQYQVYSLPGSTQQAFTVSDGFVPASQSTLSGSNQNFNLTAWMVGLSDPAHYGQLNLYEVPQGTIGPANADAEISANQAVSSEITLLNQHGSEVLLGETLMIPIGNSMVYVRPLYTAASTNPQPQLAYVVAVLGKNNVGFEKTLSGALSDVLQTTVTVPSGNGGSSGRDAAGCGCGHPPGGADRLHQRADCADGGRPGDVPVRHRGNGDRDPAGGADPRYTSPGNVDRHHYDDCAQS